MNNNQVTERALRNVFSVPNYITFGSKECVARHAAAGAGRRRGSAARGVRCPAGDTGKKKQVGGRGARALWGERSSPPCARHACAGSDAPPCRPAGREAREKAGEGGEGGVQAPARAARARVRARVRAFVLIRFWWGDASAGSGAFSAAPLALRCATAASPEREMRSQRGSGRSARDVARGARHYP